METPATERHTMTAISTDPLTTEQIADLFEVGTGRVPYDSYWRHIMGNDISAADTIEEFREARASERSVDEWLGHAEEVAEQMGVDLGRPRDRARHHVRALAEIVSAIEDE